jgi:hypothetical protein
LTTAASLGPVDLPFDHPDVRVIFDNLFRGTFDSAVRFTREDVPQEWMAALQADEPEIDVEIRVSELTQSVRGRLPEAGAPTSTGSRGSGLSGSSHGKRPPMQLAEIGVTSTVARPG